MHGAMRYQFFVKFLRVLLADKDKHSNLLIYLNPLDGNRLILYIHMPCTCAYRYAIQKGFFPPEVFSEIKTMLVNSDIASVKNEGQ